MVKLEPLVRCRFNANTLQAFTVCCLLFVVSLFRISTTTGENTMIGRSNFVPAIRFIVRDNNNKCLGVVRALTAHQAWLVARDRFGKRVQLTAA